MATAIVNVASGLSIAKKLCNSGNTNQSFGLLNANFEISSNLKLIGMIEKNKKVHVKSLSIEDVNLWTSANVRGIGKIEPQHYTFWIQLYNKHLTLSDR